MKCPKCDNVMQKVSVEDIEVDCCGNCEGIWFDLREHDHLKDIRGSEDRIDMGDPAKGDQMNAVRNIHCPRCTVQLVKLFMHDQTHIKYEQCATCGGVFLDAGEFTDFKQMTVAEKVKRVLVPFR